MSILLTDEENPFVHERRYFNDKYGKGEGDSIYNRDINAFNQGAKAQLKKVKGKIAVVELPKGKEAGYNVDGKSYVALAMLKDDWQALLKEVDFA